MIRVEYNRVVCSKYIPKRETKSVSDSAFNGLLPLLSPPPPPRWWWWWWSSSSREGSLFTSWSSSSSKTFPQYSQSILESVCNIQREREREKK